MGVGTAATGSLCVGMADFVPAFILKKKIHTLCKIKCTYPLHQFAFIKK
jgi:hypothetical protein